MRYLGLLFYLLPLLFVAETTASAQSIPSGQWVDLKGISHQLSDYRGKWVIVNYWATWCPPCLEEIPELVSFAEGHAKDSVVLGVNQERVDRRYLADFVENYFISYPILIGDEGSKTPFGRLLGLPTTFIISPKGVLVSQQIGGVTRQKLEQLIGVPRMVPHKVTHEVR